VGREDLAGVEADDRDLLLVDDGQDPPPSLGCPDLEVVQAAGPAQGDRPLLVSAVVAQAEGAGCAAADRVGLGGRGIGLCWRDPSEGPVWPGLVVLKAEGVELGLELGERPGRRPSFEPAFQRLVEALDLAWVWGWPGEPFFWRMPSQASRYSNPLRPPVKRLV